MLAVCAAVAVLLTASCRVPGARPDASRPRLSALEVTGGGALFPSFSADVRHYSVRCADGTRLRVAARAEDAAHRLTLLHNERTATGTVEDSVTVNDDHDVVVEVGDGSAAVRYTVHCIPTGFPDIVIEKRAAGVSEGLLLMTPGVRRSDPPKSFLAIIDNNGVARWVRTPDERGRNFRRHPDGRYSFSELRPDGTEPTVILNPRFEPVATATLAGDLLPEHTGGHDFLVTEGGNYLLMGYYPNPRDFGDFECGGEPCSVPVDTETDSVIQEVTPDGEVVFEWNSWDHVKIEDCTIHRFPNDYAHLNSLHELEGDIVASLRGCAQVVRIDRPTGRLIWQMGGTEPPRDAATRFLPLKEDPAGEFCGQHHVTATAAGSLLMFDNGTHCLGARKNEAAFTRIVEYDLSSGTEARFVREYRLPPEDGVAASGGGVVALEGGNWLITWGNNGPEIAVSEVDTDGNEVLRISMWKDGERYGTGRVYRVTEAALALQPNLPE